MGIDSDFGRLVADGQADPDRTRDQQISALLSHARHTTKTIDKLTCAVGEMKATLDEVGGLLAAQRVQLAENTEITSSVRDAVTAGRVAGHVIKWAGYLAAAGTALYGAWWTLTHIGQPPAGG